MQKPVEGIVRPNIAASVRSVRFCLGVLRPAMWARHCHILLPARAVSEDAQAEEDVEIMRNLLSHPLVDIEALVKRHDALVRMENRWRRQAGGLLRTARQRALQGLHKPAGLVMFPAWLLAASSAVLGVPGPQWLPITTGATIGIFFAVLNRYCNVRVHIAPPKPLGVVLTGGSKGLGKALARELILGGDRVLLTSRTQAGVDEAVNQLKEELGDEVQVYGVVCDVSNAKDVANLADKATALLGSVDVWINNAGYSGSFQPFIISDVEQLQQVLLTNLMGVTLCSFEAAKLFKKQSQGGHLFNVDGAGADGFPTPNYAVYGSTKAGIRQLSLSLQQEFRDSQIKVHLLSPGMILTDLLLEGATTANKQAFNILCEQPEVTAAFLAPRIRAVVARDVRDAYVRFLTPMSALWRFLTAPARMGKYFDAAGNPVYPEERERILGKASKATLRHVAAMRRQNRGLQIAYASALAIAVGIQALDAHLTPLSAQASNLIPM